jgi:hypothetical protein
LLGRTFLEAEDLSLCQKSKITLQIPGIGLQSVSAKPLLHGQVMQKPVYPLVKVIGHLKRSPEFGLYSSIMHSFFNFFLFLPIYPYNNDRRGIIANKALDKKRFSQLS